MSDLAELENDQPEADPAPAARPQIETLLWRGMQLKCPRCGQAKLYRTFMRMNDACPHCELRLMREPGYYLGATYVNYGVTALSMTALFFFFRVILNFPTQSIIWPLFSFSILVPILLFRHARAIWLAFDCQFDRSVLEE